MNTPLPPIPAKRYFTIGEVAELCDVKPHVLRYWEQEFTQLRPMKRRGNRRYYQHHEVLMIRRIRELLYGQGFTISGARSRLQSGASSEAEAVHALPTTIEPNTATVTMTVPAAHVASGHAHREGNGHESTHSGQISTAQQTPLMGSIDIRHELIQIRDFLSQTTSKYSL